MLGLKEALFSPGKLLLQAWFEKTEKKKEKRIHFYYLVIIVWSVV